MRRALLWNRGLFCGYIELFCGHSGLFCWKVIHCWSLLTCTHMLQGGVFAERFCCAATWMGLKTTTWRCVMIRQKTSLLFWILLNTQFKNTICVSPPPGDGRVVGCCGSPQLDLFCENRPSHALLDFDCCIFFLFSMRCLTLKPVAKLRCLTVTVAFFFSQALLVCGCCMFSFFPCNEFQSL